MRTLALLEWLNALVLFPAVARLWPMPPSAPNLAGFGLLVLFLAEGGAYWWLKYRQLLGGRRLPAGLPAFRVLRIANPLLLAAGAAVVGAGFASGAPWTHTWPGAALWAFAAVEQANYFHLQLSHGTRADWRHPRRLAAPAPHGPPAPLPPRPRPGPGPLPAVSPRRRCPVTAAAAPCPCRRAPGRR
ncbi:hypothetical protein [Nocardiopsis chromatogenes]|uniref:hypothetical protein n=1 Tax=Nocardiopsis chromatogenes TaxID=280239 RepID=UPI001EF9E5A3|nr:hypothetical protein [Nocardiopsis chromatogenes]